MYKIDVITITTEEFKLGLVSDRKRIQLAKDFINAHRKSCTDQELIQMAIDHQIRVCILERFKDESVVAERIDYLLNNKNLMIDEDTFEVGLFLMDPEAFAKQAGVPKESLMSEEDMKSAVKELLE